MSIERNKLRKAIGTAISLGLAAVMMCGCAMNGNDGEDDNATPEDTSIYNTELAKRVAPQVEAVEFTEGTAENFSVSRVFTDNMVIQRDDYIRIWGFAPESENGKTVAASFKGLNGSAVIEDGKWLITLGGTLSASTEQEHTLTVSTAAKTVEFEDVLVGDVYWCVGQSNMSTTVPAVVAEAGKDDPSASMKMTNNDNVRFYMCNSSVTPLQNTGDINEDVPHKGRWLKPTAGVSQFPAIGVFTAKQILDATNNAIPIGMIAFDVPGTALSAYIPAEVAEALGTDAWNEAKGCYVSTAADGQTSRVIYNQYIHPFVNLTMSGIIWYQGESDFQAENYKLYVERFTAVIEHYRKTVNQSYHDFPVYIVELPPSYNDPGVTAFMAFGEIRSYMGLIPASVKNSFVAAGADVWKDRTYWNNLHPYCKWDQSLRVSSLMLSTIYSDVANAESKIEAKYAEGPVAVRFEANGKNNQLTVHFRSVGDGLCCADGDGFIKGSEAGAQWNGFEALKDGAWTTEGISVEYVDENTITIKLDYALTAVRYYGQISMSYPETVSVCNSSGIPSCAWIWEAK